MVHWGGGSEPPPIGFSVTPIPLRPAGVNPIQGGGSIRPPSVFIWLWNIRFWHLIRNGIFLPSGIGHRRNMYITGTHRIRAVRVSAGSHRPLCAPLCLLGWAWMGWATLSQSLTDLGQSLTVVDASLGLLCGLETLLPSLPAWPADHQHLPPPPTP